METTKNVIPKYDPIKLSQIFKTEGANIEFRFNQFRILTKSFIS
jgi:hypothetical protein